MIPLSELGRPRIDVTVRISGFFRDAFPHLISLVDEAVHTVRGWTSRWSRTSCASTIWPT
ncbi:Aerobic cobaltochelatase subunit CobN [Chromobacterium violaceum]|uniref:Aerobic cobaltochelatase subunit CobN n=1 Tax=Chromobacterium violaceum TaxID=536 RepID=A0A447TA82_CHRVL|nr:Aerobic cobaltochelatase subunit CobN [Chromobacterium violaceum]